MKPINYRPITNALKTFIRTHFPKERVRVKPDTDLCYYYETPCIGYTLLVAERTQRLFPKFCRETLGLNYEVPVFILCFLHELGHHFTMDDFNEDQICDFEDEKDRLKDSDKDFCAYFEIGDEIAASEWAVNFINSNPKIVEQFDKDLKNALDDFLRINGVEGD